jgi:outer membrane protein assembly factor BamE (lipoprotein component of BamABCDE complex)
MSSPEALFRRIARRAPRFGGLVCIACIVCAMGCASYPSTIATGMSHAEVLERFGKPSIDRPTEDGELMIYSTAPMGQWAYAAVFDHSGSVVRVAQVLTPENFARIRKGAWDEEDVLAHFGPPAARRNIRGFEAWDYRYKEYGTYNSLFTITFDPNGVVEKAENGPDWMWDGGRGAHAK